MKGKGSAISYGHAGVGSISHVAGLVFNAKFGLTPNLIPYRGTGPVLQDMVAGQIDYTVDQSLNVIPQIKAGTIKVYAVAAPERLASMPDVPTTKEAGEDFIFSAWNAMVAPKDTPKDIVEKLVDALGKALDDPAVKARYVELGSSAPQGAERGPAGLQKLVESEVARITPVIKAANVKVESQFARSFRPSAARAGIHSPRRDRIREHCGLSICPRRVPFGAPRNDGGTQAQGRA